MMIRPLFLAAWLFVITTAEVGLPSSGDLMINVGYNEHDGSVTTAYRQVIGGNSSTDTVVLEYEEPDGTVVTQLTDFRMQSQIMRVIIPGEEELNEPAYQVLCFVSAFTGDLIAPEAVMKLRQKHPGTVRVAEDDQGNVVQDSKVVLNPLKAGKISSHLSSLCKEAKTSTFTSQHEVHAILNNRNNARRAGDVVMSKEFEGYESMQRCSAVDNLSENAACQCTRQVWINWYPCALKYCRNKDGEGEHRCGIRTCKKCLTYQYPVKSSRYCSWDRM